MQEALIIAKFLEEVFKAWNHHQATKYHKSLMKYRRVLEEQKRLGQGKWDDDIIDGAAFDIMLLKSSFLLELGRKRLESVPG